MNVIIIAEAGVNHNGSLRLAKELVVAAKTAGADVVKFQSFTASNLVTARAPKAKYQIDSDSKNLNQIEMLSGLEISPSMHEELIELCKTVDIQFLSTAFDSVSVELLSSLGQTTFKIPSGEITNLPLLRLIAKKARKVILSTGASTIEDIKNAIDIFQEAGITRENISVLHCTSAYPADFEEINLLAMQEISRLFNVNVGYSDHSTGIEVPIAAVALGASIVEKHFTISRKLEGPDHKSSLEPEELKLMVSSIRNIEKSLGKKEKRVTESEKSNQSLIRKSIVAKKIIKKGEIFSIENLTTKRPAWGISPMKWDLLIGKESRFEYSIDEFIKEIELQ